MHASAVPFVDNQFTRTLADAFPPADADTGMALVAQAALRVLNNQSGIARLQPRAPMSKQSECNEAGHVTSSYTDGYRERGMTNANETITRTNHDWLKDKPAIKKRVANCLQDFPRLKLIAKAAEASPRTVEAWTDELSLPGLEYFLRLVPRSPSIQKMLLQLMTFDPDHPEYARILNDLRGMAR
jgi:hypothetical protein